MTNFIDSPQNPFHSYLVAASAGSGKTYQLSRRFLYLVGAGAGADKILTITFTEKAAAEMRERILKEASILLTDTSRQQEFEKELRTFQNISKTHGLELKSAIETAQEILESSANLQVSTIDGLFFKWNQKYPIETNLNDELIFQENQLEILDSLKDQEINDKAWIKLLVSLSDHGKSLPFSDLMWKGKKLSDIKSQLLELTKHKNYLWLARNTRDDNAINHTYEIHGDEESYSAETLLAKVREPLKELIASLNKEEMKDELYSYLADDNFEDIIKSSFVTLSKQAVSGQLFGKKKAEQYAAQLAVVNQAIADYLNFDKLCYLNASNDEFNLIHNAFEIFKSTIKSEGNYISFDDLTRGAYLLFKREWAAAARYMINLDVKHLMIDEFQDTSRLQWEIFEALSHEILSEGSIQNAPGESPSTVFIVGDKKQSIYGFREADPTVIEDAYQSLAPYGMKLYPMNQSYRSAELVLSSVNQFCEPLFRDFPVHSAAKIGDSYAQENISEVTVIHAFQQQKVADENSEFILKNKDYPDAEIEAAYIASMIEEILDKPQLYPVSDGGRLRPIRPSDIAILYRKSEPAKHFENELRLRSIATLREEKKGFFFRQEIRDLVNLITYFANPSDTNQLACLLKSPFIRLSDKNFLKLCEVGSEDSGKLESFGVVHALEAIDPQSFKRLESLQDCYESTNISELVYKTTADHSYLSHLKSTLSEAEFELCLKNIQQFVELIVDLENKGNYLASDLVKKLRDMSETNETGNAAADGECVSLMTIHKSKGLEFPMVFVVGCNSRWAKSDSYWLKTEKLGAKGVYYLGKSDDQPKNFEEFDRAVLQSDTDLVEESHRLLYVALTRASQYLIISGNNSAGSGRKVGEPYLPSMLESISNVNGVCQESFLGHTLHRVTSNNLAFYRNTEQQSSELDSNSRPKGSTQPKVFSPENYACDPFEIKSVTPTGIEPTEVELGFKLESSEVPAEMSADYGNFIHEALEAFFKQRKLPENLEDIWQRHIKAFSTKYHPKELEDLKNLAITEIKAVVSSEATKTILDGASRVYAELPITDLTRNRLTSGVADLVVQKEGRVWIVDYKTTHLLPKAATPQMVQSYCDKAGYSRQLGEYSSMIEKIFKGHKVESFILFTTNSNLHKLG